VYEVLAHRHLRKYGKSRVSRRPQGVQGLVELLSEKGLLTKQGVLERVKKLQAESAKKLM
jgi:hypothetical protein